jgi:hypothetical protein
MRRIKRLLSTTAALLLLGWLVVGRMPLVKADTASAPSLVVSQLKITASNGQFITLYNATDATLDMSKYQLEYFNNYDLTKATSSKLISLDGSLPPHSYYLVNDSSLVLCYQLTVDSVSLDLSSTAGLVEVLGFNQAGPGASAVPVLQDYVGWSKTAATGAQTLPANVNAFLQRQPVDSQDNPSITVPGSGSWQAVQPDPANACNLLTASATPTSVPTGLTQLLPSTEPPATIVNLSDSDDAAPATPTPSLPASDIGLMAPQITELLPNPAGTGNDATDEYIELYNPNATAFDLSGFGLQVGLTALHNYSFPTGTSLPPKAFVAFYSATTGLSLSNTDSQASLLDPFGNPLSTTQPYSNAKDGQAWALAKGSWYWTTSPTPNAANIIKQPVSARQKAAAAKAKKAKASAVKGAKTTKTTETAALSGDDQDQPTTTPIHVRTLALVAGLALLYAAYEYRADAANRIHQFRRYLANRRRSRA